LNYQGPIYDFANYGDTLRLFVEASQMHIFGLFGVYDQRNGNSQRLAKSQWVAANVIEGGIGKLYDRAVEFLTDNGAANRTILYFLLFDPASLQPVEQIADPRPALPTDFDDPAIGRLLARTDWTPNAT
jgi:hypothetical protein